MSAARVRADNGQVHDIAWDDVKEWFDLAENGSAPDVIVHDTTLADWERLLELMRSEGWRCDYDFREQGLPLPVSAAEIFVRDPDGERPTLRVWPGLELEWIIRPWSTDEIVSDVSLHDIQGQERLDAFCRFLRTLGARLGKRILVYAEGDLQRPPMMAYEVVDDRVSFLAPP
jgi:hypothetical protein